MLSLEDLVATPGLIASTVEYLGSLANCLICLSMLASSSKVNWMTPGAKINQYCVSSRVILGILMGNIVKNQYQSPNCVEGPLCLSRGLHYPCRGPAHLSRGPVPLCRGPTW